MNTSEWLENYRVNKLPELYMSEEFKLQIIDMLEEHSKEAIEFALKIESLFTKFMTKLRKKPIYLRNFAIEFNEFAGLKEDNQKLFDTLYNKIELNEKVEVVEGHRGGTYYKIK